jgi:hypothetical protein
LQTAVTAPAIHDRRSAVGDPAFMLWVVAGMLAAAG